MIRFPEIVESAPPEQQARERLDYMLKRAALDTWGTGSLRRLAEEAGLDPSTIYKSIDRGSFAYDSAKKIEGALGRKRVRYEHLMEPLTV